MRAGHFPPLRGIQFNAQFYTADNSKKKNVNNVGDHAPPRKEIEKNVELFELHLVNMIFYLGFENVWTKKD